MARPSEISTKTVSARIPMEDYIKFIKEATDNKLSLQEYLTVRIYQEDKSKEYQTELDKLTKQVEALIKEKKSIDTELKKLSPQVNKAAEENKTLKAQVTDLQKVNKLLQAKLDTISKSTEIYKKSSDTSKARTKFLDDRVNQFQTELSEQKEVNRKLSEQVKKLAQDKTQILNKNKSILQELTRINIEGISFKESTWKVIAEIPTS